MSLIVGTTFVLCGCVSLLPKTPPSQLYRFAFAGPPAASIRLRPAFLPTLGAVTLPRAVAGDGILTVRGGEVAYVAGARWVSPAVDLLREAAEQALSTSSGARAAAPAPVLVLEGRSFETRYSLSDAAPTVRVAIHAALDQRDGRRLAERTFTAEAPAAENRMGAIVAAYDLAVAATLRDVVAWATQPVQSPAT